MDGMIHSTTHSALLASLSLAPGERLRLGSGNTHNPQGMDRLPPISKWGVWEVSFGCAGWVSGGQEGGSLSRWIQ